MRLQSLQILRLLAALAVVVHHLLLHFDTDMHAPALHVTADFGVDIFFVISGFIISLSTRRTYDPAFFMAKRFARILPTYWSLTLCVFLLGLIAPSLLSHPSTDLLDLLRSLLFLAYPNSAGIYQPILFVGWTLNYEMFFYISFAFFMAIIPRRRYVIPSLISFFLILSVLHFSSLSSNGAFGFYSSGLILEFCGGIALQQFFAQRDYAPLPFGALLLPVGFIASALLNQLQLDDDRAFILGIPAMLTVAGAVSWKPNPTRLIRLLVLGGNASYAMYLTHPFLVSGCTKFAMHFMGNGPLSLAVTGVATVGLSIVVGIVFYRFIECPAHDWLLVKLGDRQKVAVAHPL